MTNQSVYTFENSNTCRGVGIADAGQSHDVIEINGYYPSDGEWARNKVAEEQVIIAQGRGGVAIRGVGYTELDMSLDTKRAVVIPAGAWFRWQGDMTISMVCRPAFDPEYYEVRTDIQIETGGES